jgi:hypothetical protein
LKAERLKVNSAEPLPPTSTWSRDLFPGFSRRVILSLPGVPTTLSWPLRMPAPTFGASGAPDADGDQNMTAARIASAAAKTVAPRRPSPSLLVLMMNSNVGSTSSSLIAMPDWLLAIVEPGDAYSHRGDTPVFAVP